MAKGDPFLLDTSAFIALTDQEAGHERVAELVRKAAGNDVKVHACFVSLTEVQYTAEYDHGEAKAREIIAHLKTLPITWEHSDDALCDAAATFKAKQKVSFADSFVLATAQRFGATLVHKDPEFVSLAGVVPQEVLPFKTPTKLPT